MLLRTFLLLSLCGLFIFAGTRIETASVLVAPKNVYPADLFTDHAQNCLTWTFNGKSVNYSSGNYTIPINDRALPDTVLMLTDRSAHYFDHEKRKGYYSSRSMGLDTEFYFCNFRREGNYKLDQSYRWNPFELFSLDSFNTAISYRFAVKGMKPGDTLYYSDRTQHQTMITADTTFLFSDLNSDWKRNVYSHFSVHDTIITYGCSFDLYYGPPQQLMEFTYIFLGPDHMDAEYNHATGELKMQIR